MEAEAVLTILMGVQRRECHLVSSEIVDTEIDQNPDLERQRKIRDILSLASSHVSVGPRQSARLNELSKHGFGAYDAAHLACAEAAGVNVLLTTDDDFINKAQRLGVAKVRVCNPVAWFTEGEL